MELHEKLFYESELKGLEIIMQALKPDHVLYRACQVYEKMIKELRINE